MKYLIIPITTIFLLFSCCIKHKEDNAFKERYFNMLDSMSSYYEFTEMDVDISIPILRERSKEFEKCADYLGYLTNIKFHFTEVENIPVYNTKSDFVSDMNALKKWYEINKYDMTNHKADSIVLKKIKNKNLRIWR